MLTSWNGPSDASAEGLSAHGEDVHSFLTAQKTSRAVVLLGGGHTHTPQEQLPWVPSSEGCWGSWGSEASSLGFNGTWGRGALKPRSAGVLLGGRALSALEAPHLLCPCQ